MINPEDCRNCVEKFRCLTHGKPIVCRKEAHELFKFLKANEEGKEYDRL